MKILHVIHSVDPRGGGPIEGIRQLIPAMLAHGIETEVMSLDVAGAPGTADFPVPLHTLGSAQSGYGYSAQAVPWLKANRERYHAVIVNGLWQYGGLAIWRSLNGTSTPYYVYPHGMLDPWFKRRYPLKHLKKWLYWPWAEYRVLRDAAAVLFTAEEERLEARKSFWLYQCRERITGYGIVDPPANADEQRESFLARFPELRGKRLILFLGRVHEKKGCDLLLRAWAELLASGAVPGEFQLVMAGPAVHAYGAEMQALARDLKIEPRVTWTGMLTGDLKWGSLRAAGAFILPSHQENFGISVVEALACGVPVLISNRVNIWREIEADGAGLVSEDDLPGTGKMIRHWLELDPPAREKMRSMARQCFLRRFEIAAVADALQAILLENTV